MAYSGGRRVAAVGIAVACLAVASLAGAPATDGDYSRAGLAAVVADQVVADQAAADQAAAGQTVAGQGVLGQGEAASPTYDSIKVPDDVVAQAKAGAETVAPPAKTVAPPAKKAVPADQPPKPVAGLTQVQMNNAQKIVKAGQDLGVPKRGLVIAIATALQESQLKNLASRRLPESYNYTNEGSGSDHDSVGLFQQRPSTGWGTVKNLMNPDYAAKAFYRALLRVAGWEKMALTQAAQRVQRSAFPSAYAKHETRAQQIVNALLS